MYLLLLFWSALVSSSITASGSALPERIQYPVFVQDTVDAELLIKLVNQVRKKGCTCGSERMRPVDKVVWNKKLAAAAGHHSRNMLEADFFSHNNPRGQTPGDRARESGYFWKAIGENIILGYTTEEEVITNWLQSEYHCRNIMNPLFREMGVGRAGKYWTQLFGWEQ